MVRKEAIRHGSTCTSSFFPLAFLQEKWCRAGKVWTPLCISPSAGTVTPASSSEYCKHQPKVLSSLLSNIYLIISYRAEQLSQYLNTQRVGHFQSSFQPLCQRREPKSGWPVTSLILQGNTGQPASPLAIFCRALMFSEALLDPVPAARQTGHGSSWHDHPGTGFPGPPGTSQVKGQVRKDSVRPHFGQSCQVHPHPLVDIKSRIFLL